MEFEEEMKKLNITEDRNGETLIGKLRDIQNLFLFMIKYDIDNIDLDIEELLISIDEKTEFIKDLYKSGYSYETMIQVWYHPMGAFGFKKYEEEE